MDHELTETQRHPLLTDAGRALLRWLHEHEAAPRFNHRCGDRLTAAGLARVRAFGEMSLRGAFCATKQSSAYERDCFGPDDGPRNDRPSWLLPFAAWCYRDVPFYRGRRGLPGEFSAIPTCDREDLGRGPWRFVPDAQPLDDLIVYTTSGTTTGHRLEIPSHPEVAAMYLPLLEAALATRGVRLEGGAGRVSIVLVCWQRRTYTYATVLSYLGGAGYAKINLNPADWRDPADRARYLDACAAEIYTGDPLAFAALAELPLTTRPKALISTAMALLPGLRQQLEARFGCSVLDLYSLNEVGPVAVGINSGESHVPGTCEVPGTSGTSGMMGETVFRLLQPRLHVEVLDAAGQPCPPGVRGEITLTGGFNPFLPLLRYRTGDTAALEFRDGCPVLVGLEGRRPVVFRGRDGQPINNVDVSAALRPFALAQFQLHQAENGDLTLHVRDLTPRPPLLPGEGEEVSPLPRREGVGGGLRAALLSLFGADQPLTIEQVDAFDATRDKVAAYTCAVDIPRRENTTMTPG